MKNLLSKGRGHQEASDPAAVAQVRAWVEADPEAVIAWLNSLPEEGKERQLAIETTMNMVVDTNPAMAFEFVNGINNEEVRQGRLLGVVRQWATADPAAADAYLRAASLSDEERVFLLQAVALSAAK